MICIQDKVVICIHDLCDNKCCLNIRNTVCVSKSCGECLTRFHNATGDDVTDLCSK